MAEWRKTDSLIPGPSAGRASRRIANRILMTDGAWELFWWAMVKATVALRFLTQFLYSLRVPVVRQFVSRSAFRLPAAPAVAGRAVDRLRLDPQHGCSISGPERHTAFDLRARQHKPG